MVQETNLEGQIVFKCEKCGWMYRDKSIAEKCENYCEKHRACNIEYQRFAIKPMKLIQK